MIELQVIVDKFKDAKTKKEYKIGDIFKCEKQRGAYLINRGICKFVTEVKEELKQEKIK